MAADVLQMEDRLADLGHSSSLALLRGGLADAGLMLPAFLPFLKP
jgi:hypothetical protein